MDRKTLFCIAVAGVAGACAPGVGVGCAAGLPAGRCALADIAKATIKALMGRR